jgi:hypothetical protein
MTRTEYTNAIRRAGFSVQPVWQAESKASSSGKDVTCYRVHSAAGGYITDLVVRDISGGDGLDVFFASPHLRVSDDLAQLERLARGIA